MTNLEKKALNHVLALVESVDFIQLYISLGKILDLHNIEGNEKRVILEQYDKECSFNKNSLNESKKWLTEIISDQK